MNCPHGRDLTSCRDCLASALTSLDDAGMQRVAKLTVSNCELVSELAHCPHASTEPCEDAEGVSSRYCPRCGAMQTLGENWRLPTLALGAKLLDSQWRLGDRPPPAAADDSFPKNVTPIKPRT